MTPAPWFTALPWPLGFPERSLNFQQPDSGLLGTPKPITLPRQFTKLVMWTVASFRLFPVLINLWQALTPHSDWWSWWPVFQLEKFPSLHSFFLPDDFRDQTCLPRDGLLSSFLWARVSLGGLERFIQFIHIHSYFTEDILGTRKYNREKRQKFFNSFLLRKRNYGTFILSGRETIRRNKWNTFLMVIIAKA